jgi:hypothetical protein
MAKCWKPTPEERIGWDHPIIKITNTAPGYLVQELLGYEDSFWPQWLNKNKNIWKSLNRRPWVDLRLLAGANSEEDNEAD